MSASTQCVNSDAPVYRTGTFAGAAGPTPIFRSAVSAVDTTDVCSFITTRSGFDALENDWNALFERAGRSEQMFQTFNWLWHWATHYLKNDTQSLAIVTIRRRGTLVAILPLMVERVAGLKQLVFMGAPVSQYGDAVVDAVPDISEVLQCALKFAIEQSRVDVVRLAKVRSDAAIAPVMAALNADTTGIEDAPFAHIAEMPNHAAYAARFSNKTLKNRRRLERRLSDHGTIALNWDMSGADAAHAVGATMVLKRAWLKTRNQLSRAFADQRTDGFFADVCANNVRPAGGGVMLMTSGGEIANAAITVTVKGRQAVHILAYGLKFEKCAAGVLHVEKLVEHAFETGVQTIDFLAPRHDYKNEWCDGAVRVADYALPVTLVGMAYARIYLKHVRERLKTLVKSAPKRGAGMVAVIQRALRNARG